MELRYESPRMSPRIFVACKVVSIDWSLPKIVVAFSTAKFLVDHEGVPYKRYSPKTPPFDLKGDIESLLTKKEASK